MAGGTPFWIVIDGREAHADIQSGVGRYVVAMTHALKDVLERDSNLGEGFKILMVFKNGVPAWAAELARSSPKIVSVWVGGPGLLGGRWNKPTWLWSTLFLKRVAHFTGGRFVWLASGNFDRPLTFGTSHLKQKILQTIYDVIPLEHPEGHSLAFRLHFRWLVGHNWKRLPHVVTISRFGHDSLKKVFPDRKPPALQLSIGVDEIFGSKPALLSPTEKKNHIQTLLRGFGVPEHLAQECAVKPWAIGVGRDTKYKRWDVGKAACQMAREQGVPVIWVRVLPESQWKQAPGQPVSAKIKWDEAGQCLFLWGLSDLELMEFYRGCAVQLHPSEQEGFGLPPLEAVCSGLPVIWRQGTAVDHHLSKERASDLIWRGVSDSTPSVWAEALCQMIREPWPADLKAQWTAKPARQAVRPWFPDGYTHSWADSAAMLFDYIQEHIYTQQG